MQIVVPVHLNIVIVECVSVYGVCQLSGRDDKMQQ